MQNIACQNEVFVLICICCRGSSVGRAGDWKSPCGQFNPVPRHHKFQGLAFRGPFFCNKFQAHNFTLPISSLSAFRIQQNYASPGLSFPPFIQSCQSFFQGESSCAFLSRPVIKPVFSLRFLFHQAGCQFRLPPSVWWLLLNAQMQSFLGEFASKNLLGIFSHRRLPGCYCTRLGNII